MKLTLILLMACLLSGCETWNTGSQRNGSATMMAHPEWQAAKEHAPALTKQMLLYINQLEYELEKNGL